MGAIPTPVPVRTEPVAEPLVETPSPHAQVDGDTLGATGTTDDDLPEVRDASSGSEQQSAAGTQTAPARRGRGRTCRQASGVSAGPERMVYYLVDASAFIYAMENRRKLKLNIFQERAEGRAFLYLPQFCVAEVLNAYARLHYRDKTMNDEQYRAWRKKFMDSLEDRTILYPYELQERHLANADAIYEYSHQQPLGRNQTPLSAFDILIIAMAMELKRVHRPNPVVLLTRDGRLEQVGRNFVTTQWLA